MKITKADREALRLELCDKGYQPADIARVMQARFRVRPRLALRWAQGMSLQDVAREWNHQDASGRAPMTTQRVSEYERWPDGGRRPTVYTLLWLARIYGTNVERLLDERDYTALDDKQLFEIVELCRGEVTAHDTQAHRNGNTDNGKTTREPASRDVALQHPMVLPQSMPEGIPVKRREVIVVTAGAAMGVVLPPEALWSPPRLGQPDVDRWRQELTRLYELDDHYGGAGGVYDLAVRSLRQFRHSLQRARYSVTTGLQLQSIVGALTEHAGWLAFDANRQADARYWWLEALQTARLAEDAGVSTVVYASMSLQASGGGRPGEAVELAHAAQSTAKSRATPRLRSLLLAREARGHARAGDASAARQALHLAGSQLEGTFHDDDPPWLGFWGPADLACHEMGVAVNLGDLGAAEQAARDSVAAVDETAYPRNYAAYLTNLADVLVTRGNLDEALFLATDAVVRSADLDSGRVTAKACALVRRLGRYESEPAVRDFLEWARQTLSP